MSVFELPNYTQVPNYIIDIWMPKLSHAEFKFIMLIVRMTCGYHRREAHISTKDFMKGCSISSETVWKCTEKFIKMGWISVVRGNSTTASLFKINCKKEEESEDLKEKLVTRSARQGISVSEPPTIGKHTYKKENIKERQTDGGGPSSFESLEKPKQVIIKKIVNDEVLADKINISQITELFSKYALNVIKRALNKFRDYIDQRQGKIRKSPHGLLKAFLEESKKEEEDRKKLAELFPDDLD